MYKVLQVQSRIQASALRGLTGKLGVNTEGNYCLQFARKVIEDALLLGDRGFYKMIKCTSALPSAKEAEALIRANMPHTVVDSPQVGDLVFWAHLPPQWGHVGVVVDLNGNGILEVAQNTTRTRNVVNQYKGALRTIALSDMPKPTTIARIRP